MTKFIVILSDSKGQLQKYIKYTCKFGPFHGRIVLTPNQQEARMFTREKDAKRVANVFNIRTVAYREDKERFGHLTASTLLKIL